MPSNLPPEERPKVKPLVPLVLDRTVIAVPLLEEVQEDLHLMAKVEKTYPTVFQKVNSAIDCWMNELDREFEAPELDRYTILRSL